MYLKLLNFKNIIYPINLLNIINEHVLAMSIYLSIEYVRNAYEM